MTKRWLSLLIITLYLVGRSTAFDANSDLDLSTFIPSQQSGHMFIGSPNDYLGYSLSVVGDVNQDGFNDFIASAPQASPSGRTLAGTSFMIFGTAHGVGTVDINTWASSPAAGFKIIGALPNDMIGTSVSGAGDYNNDGCADILVLRQ